MSCIVAAAAAEDHALYVFEGCAIQGNSHSPSGVHFHCLDECIATYKSLRLYMAIFAYLPRRRPPVNYQPHENSGRARLVSR
ncbi:hypothetical protein GTP90_01380 [Rugamonas sp. FT81W]|uniref:Uncharacterized protein n=2 Tax=Duganella vulcania TaxID=2692166 RepID=A0A845GHJ9_9BURK|nr:hypothetical protein [Duganella vulcania]